MRNRRYIVALIIGVSCFVSACSSGISVEDYNKAVSEAAQAQEKIKTIEAENQSLEAEVESALAQLDEKEKSFESLNKEYSEYKESMSEL